MENVNRTALTDDEVKETYGAFMTPEMQEGLLNKSKNKLKKI